MDKFSVEHQVQIFIPAPPSKPGTCFIADKVWKNGDGKWIIDDTKLTLSADFTDNQKDAIKALINGQGPFTVRSAERVDDGFWSKGESVVIDYFGRTNGNGDPMSKIYEPFQEFVRNLGN